MTSPRNWRPLKGLVGVIGISLYRTRIADLEVRNETVHYWEAWFYLGVFFGASILITCYLIESDPALLRRRLIAGPTAEKEKAQEIVMLNLLRHFTPGSHPVSAIYLRSQTPGISPIQTFPYIADQNFSSWSVIEPGYNRLILPELGERPLLQLTAHHTQTLTPPGD